MDIEAIEQENDKVPKVKKRYDICKQCDKFTEEKLCFQCGCLTSGLRSHNVSFHL